MNPDNANPYESLSRSDKLKKLFEQQKHVLDCFLERGAISKAEYEKSLNGLKDKMKTE